MKNYYYILGVEKSATLAEIKTAYRWHAKKFHPDYNKDDKFSEARFRDIQEAYETLSDSEKRKIYDNELEIYDSFDTSTRQTNQSYQSNNANPQTDEEKQYSHAQSDRTNEANEEEQYSKYQFSQEEFQSDTPEPPEPSNLLITRPIFIIGIAAICFIVYLIFSKIEEYKSQDTTTVENNSTNTIKIDPNLNRVLMVDHYTPFTSYIDYPCVIKVESGEVMILPEGWSEEKALVCTPKQNITGRKNRGNVKFWTKDGTSVLVRIYKLVDDKVESSNIVQETITPETPQTKLDNSDSLITENSLKSDSLVNTDSTSVKDSLLQANKSKEDTGQNGLFPKLNFLPEPPKENYRIDNNRVRKEYSIPVKQPPQPQYSSPTQNNVNNNSNDQNGSTNTSNQGYYSPKGYYEPKGYQRAKKK